MLQIKRIYEEPAKNDGARVLVDRLWPRGVSKEKAALDFWLKEVAPSPELRIWFDHKSEKFEEFSKKYVHELSQNPAINELEKIIKENKNITLLYAAKDPEINHVIVLKKFLEKK